MSEVITRAEAVEVAEREYGIRSSEFGAHCWHIGSDRDTHFSHGHRTMDEARACCAERRQDLVERILDGRAPVWREASGTLYLP